MFCIVFFCLLIALIFFNYCLQQEKHFYLSLFSLFSSFNSSDYHPIYCYFNNVTVFLWLHNLLLFFIHNKHFLLRQVCVQCGSPPSITANNLHEQIVPLKISQHSSDLAQSLSSRSRNNSPPASFTNIENSRRTMQNKWTCVVCVGVVRVLVE